MLMTPQGGGLVMDPIEIVLTCRGQELNFAIYQLLEVISLYIKNASGIIHIEMANSIDPDQDLPGRIKRCSIRIFLEEGV